MPNRAEEKRVVDISLWLPGPQKRALKKASEAIGSPGSVKRLGYEQKSGALTILFSDAANSRNFHAAVSSDTALAQFVSAAHYSGKQGPSVLLMPRSVPASKGLEQIKGRTLIAHLNKALNERKLAEKHG
jgi:hypothetical protein